LVDIAPFRGVRYDEAVAGPPLATSAPAYEDVDPVDYAAHRTANPYTVLELIAPSEGGYTAAGHTLTRWLRTGVLRREPAPSLYRYEQHELRAGVPAVQRGVLAALRLEPLGDGVLPHEQVDATRLEARRRRLSAVPIDLSPVFTLTTDAVPALHAVLGQPPQSAPIIGFTDEQSVDHRIWAIDDAAALRTLVEALASVRLMIADGHHRYAAALAAGATHTLAFIVDPHRHGPRVRPIHRLVEGVPDDLPARLEADVLVEPSAAPPAVLARSLVASDRLAYGLVLPGGRTFTLIPRDLGALERRLPAGPSAPWRRLDAALLEHALLPSLGDALEMRYRTDPGAGVPAGAALFLLRPPGLRTVISMAAAGEMLPAKTTSFVPKPRTGLVLRLLDEGT
jgi:hypothetical protein